MPSPPISGSPLVGFADWQESFQKAIVDGDDAVLATLTEGAREDRATLLGVYRHAYVARIVEAMRKEHEALHGFLGDETFDEMAAAYVAAHPSRHPSMRWVSRHLPTFLTEAEPYNEYPVVAELAAFEKALNDAFDAADGPVLTTEALAAIPPEAWQDLVVVTHPAARRLDLATNAAAIWSALREEETPPDAETLAAPARIVVWRHETTPMWREMSAEEAMMWDEAAAGLPFGQLCVMLATMDDPDTAAGRAAGLLGGWINAGMLAEAHVAA